MGHYLLFFGSLSLLNTYLPLFFDSRGFSQSVIGIVITLSPFIGYLSEIVGIRTIFLVCALYVFAMVLIFTIIF